MFSFGLSESSDLARDWLEERGAADVSGWKRVDRSWRKAKGALGAALDAQTWRRTWQLDIQGNDNDLARLREFWPAAADLGLPVELISGDEVLAGAVRKKEQDGGLVPWCQEAGIKGVAWGQKLSRAMAAILVHSGRTKDEASAAVGKLFEAFHKRRTGTMVLSANILDILTVSEFASFKSCHELGGCHRAGPQQYLHDASTLVAYFFTETVTYGDDQLPKKLWRQMVHVDGASAAFMREYGSALDDGAHKILRRHVAELLRAMTGEQIPADGVDWSIVREREGKPNPIAHAGAALAYVDPWQSVIRLTKDKWPSVQLARSVPCPCCDRELTSYGELTCSGGERCHGCDGRLDEDGAHAVGDYSYCESCYGERFSCCEWCEEDCVSEDMSCVCDRYVCSDCRSNNFTCCNGCDEYFLDADSSRRRRGSQWERMESCSEGPDGDSYCPDCYSERFAQCELCEEDCDKSDMHTVDDKQVCDGCHDDLPECAHCGETNLADDLQTSQLDSAEVCADCECANERAGYPVVRADHYHLSLSQLAARGERHQENACASTY